MSNSVLGTGIAWRMRGQSKGDFLAGNRTQSGQTLFDAVPFPPLLLLADAGMMSRGEWHRLIVSVISDSRHCDCVYGTWTFDTNFSSSAAFPLALNFIASGE